MSNMWGNLISGGLGLLQNFVSGRNSAKAADRAFSYSKILQDRQYQYTRELNRNAYQDTTYSMRQAGINPMLAISNGVNSLSGPSGSVPSVTPADTGISSALAYLQYKREKKLTDSTLDVNKTQARMNDYLGDKAHYESAMAREQTQLLQDYGPMLKHQEYLQSVANTAKILNDIKNNNALTNAQVANIKESTNSAKYLNVDYKRRADWINNRTIPGAWISDWARGLGLSPSLRLR